MVVLAENGRAALVRAARVAITDPAGAAGR